MDFESDMEELAAAPVPLSQFPSDPWHAGDDTDFVKWQGSQSNSVALNALIHEAAEPARRSPRNHRTQHLRTALNSGFSFSSSSSSSSASSASSAPRTKPRMSRTKVRHNPVRKASPSVVASTPASTLCSDPMKFLQTLKGVSEKVRVDETMRAKKRLVSGEIKAPASVTTAIRSGKQKENLRRTASAMKDRPRSPVPLSASRSLPTMDTEDVNMYMDMDISARMDVDGDLNSNSISEPSIFRSLLAATATECSTSPKRDTSSSRPRFLMPPPPVPAPKAHPPPTLLRTPAPTRAPSSPKPKPPQKLSQPPVATAPTIPEPPPASPPRTQLLSSQRPRALGMRRAFPTYSTTTTSFQSLPEKQRAFKVPLAKPPCPPRTVASTAAFPAKPTREREIAAPFPSPPSPLGADADAINKGAGIHDGDGSSSPSPGSPADPDSSYGDLSFDMDALEETMQNQLFGEDEDVEGELDDAEKQGKNVQKIATLRKEAQAFKAVRTALRSSAATGDASRIVFQKTSAISFQWRTCGIPAPHLFRSISTPSGGGGGNGTGSREVSVYEDKRVLSDPDWDDNMERTLESLNVTRGKFLTIVDEDGAWGTIAIGLGILPPNHPVDAAAFILPSPLSLPPRKECPVMPPPPNSATSKNRNAPDDDEIIEVEPSSKRAKTNGNGPSAPALTSPSKKRRLEEEGCS